ncbi:hypothetical protein KL937_005299 [Ogataea polymorpha]|nr:hypothetical protein KL937_005299 [Ogataea polymorpha]KAG7931000.1 hypothetical protein KL904_005339 [Ogataea polymorpha]
MIYVAVPTLAGWLVALGLHDNFPLHYLHDQKNKTLFPSPFSPMQYVGRAIGSVSKTWSSINPATLSGAIDVIVVEQPDGELACSPFHVRFGKFQLLRPSQKKVEFIVNGEVTDLPMKLGDGGEAFFVFETDGYIPPDLQTSPVISPVSSPGSSPKSSEPTIAYPAEEPEYLDIGEGANDSFSASVPSTQSDSALLEHSPSNIRKAGTASSFDRAKKISSKLTKKNIPSKVEANGDIMLDMQGYKSNDQNIHDSDAVIRQLLIDEFGDDVDINALVDKDLHGNIRILSSDDLADDESMSLETHTEPQSPASSASSVISDIDTDTVKTQQDNHFKTLRLTSEQLKCLSLKPGENDLQFSVNKGRALVSAKLFLWKHNVPIVISDIDGTITKSDALGHVLTMLGRDWTHVGVAKLFADIQFNGYNIMYLTARSVGLADSTRSYLNGIVQDGIKLPVGPVILSPDRTIAALKREIVLKKPEVFKMACLNDIKALYDKKQPHNAETPDRDLSFSRQAASDHSYTPFYAGFGNRITDALSYRNVGIPSSRIFTINPDGDVHMELLEMAGYKSSYVSIGELVDQFFPPVNISRTREGALGIQDTVNQFSDVNFWRNPVLNLSDLSDDESESEAEQSKSRDELTSAGANSQRLGGFFSRSPASRSTEPETEPEAEYSFDEDDENENLDPDYVYEDEDLDDDYDEDDYEDDVDDKDEDLDEELDGELLDERLVDNEAPEYGSSPNRILNPSFGIASPKSLTNLNVDTNNATGTFIKAKQMLQNLSLEDAGEKK